MAARRARVTGRPAKLRLDRDDDFAMTGKRHDFEVDYRAAVDADGRITAVDVGFASRCGYSHDLSSSINDRTMFHADNTYFYPQVHIRSRRLKTHTVSNTAFRGFGGPQGMVFAERLMDHIAWATGRDPLDVRYANLYGTTDRNVTPYGMTVEDNVAGRPVTRAASAAIAAQPLAWLSLPPKPPPMRRTHTSTEASAMPSTRATTC